MNQYPFQLKIYTHSDTALKHGIKNQPNQKIIKNLRSVHKHITTILLNNFGNRLILTSGYRCPELNKLVGGKTNSQHIYGKAIDFEVLGLSNQQLFEWCKRKINYDQLIIEGYKEGEGPHSGWIHCSYNRAGNRNMAFELPNKKDRNRIRDMDKKNMKKLLELKNKKENDENINDAVKKEVQKIQTFKSLTHKKVIKRKKNILIGIWYLLKFLCGFFLRKKKK